jgi:hypothetical protein
MPFPFGLPLPQLINDVPCRLLLLGLEPPVGSLAGHFLLSTARARNKVTHNVLGIGKNLEAARRAISLQIHRRMAHQT